MPASRITDQELKQYVRQGLDAEEIAAEKSMNVRSVRNRLSKLGLSPKRANRKWVVPGQVALATEDNDAIELRYLRVLGAVADGDRRDLVLVTTARNWATRLINEGKDIIYDITRPYGQRWVIIDADPQAWHVKMVLESAKAGRRLTLADVA